MATDEVSKSLKMPFQRNSRGNGKKGDKRAPDGDESELKSLRKQGQKSRNRRRDRGIKRPLPGVKLVLRLLPPTLTKDQLLETLKPVVGEFSQWHLLQWYYVEGYYTSKIFAEPVYSRCYFIFENIDMLKKFAQLVEPLTFVDDKDNSAKAVLKISSYCESYNDVLQKPTRNSEALQGTLENDLFFKTFLKSIKLMEDSPEYSYVDINLLKPLEKELDKQKGMDQAIQKRSDMALVALAGDDKPKKGKKKKKPSAQKNEKNDSKSAKDAKPKKPRSKKAKKSEVDPNRPNNNVVIIEAAGKKELQRRKKVQEKPIEKTKSSKKSAKKQVKLLKKEPSETS